MRILLLSDPPHLKNGHYYTPLAIPLINGYFAGDRDVAITHLFVTPAGAIEEAVDLESFDLVGYSCLESARIFALWPHVERIHERFYVGGPGLFLVRDRLQQMGINYFEGFGEWLVEDKLGRTRNSNIYSEQKVLLTDRLSRFFEENTRQSNHDILLLIANGYGCPWSRCKFCHFKLSTMATSVYHTRCVFKPFDNLRAICLSLKEQTRSHRARAWLTSFDMPPAILEQTADVMDGVFKWFCFLRPRRYPEKLFKRIRAKGFLGANVGVEVAHDEGLALLNKGTTLADIEWTLKALRKARVPIIEIGYITHIPEFYKLDEALENLRRHVLPYIKTLELYKLEITLGSEFYEERLRRGQTPTDYGMDLNLGEELTRLNDEYCRQLRRAAKAFDVAVV